MQAGDKLKNGATALHFLKKNQDKLLVLADWPGHHHRFVTWRLDPNGNTYLGHYFNNIEEALKDLNQR